MSGVTQRCQLDGCNRPAAARCFCCNKNVCTRHFTEHVDTIKSQIGPLNNEIETMVENIQDLTVEQLTQKPITELKKWQNDMHQLIDYIFSAKMKEIEDLIEKNKAKFNEYKKQQTEMILKIQDEMKQLTEDNDATYEQIQSLKNQLVIVEKNVNSFQNDFILVNTRLSGHNLVTISSSTFNFDGNSKSTGDIFDTATPSPPFTFEGPTIGSTTSMFGSSNMSTDGISLPPVNNPVAFTPVQLPDKFGNSNTRKKK